MPETPKDDPRIARARAAWQFRGQKRPDFAVEPGPDQESVWDYPRPPAIRPEPRPVRVISGAVTLADSIHAVRVCETGSPPTLYVPPQDVAMDLMTVSPTRSFCEWKGQARYFRLKGAAGSTTDIAWCYPDPLPGFEPHAGWICFYPGRVACFLDGERVIAQPGGYYGGWITADVVGPFKGEHGTSHW